MFFELRVIAAHHLKPHFDFVDRFIKIAIRIIKFERLSSSHAEPSVLTCVGTWNRPVNQENLHNSVQIDVPLVRQLVADQFPDWADLPVRPVEINGHDNRTFHLGNEMSVRLPSAQRYSAHVKTEQEWLPKLAPHLPLPIPVPLGMGKPADAYPWHWTINSWLEGENMTIGSIDNLSQFASDLAHFLNVLQRINTKDAPPPGPDNFYRGGELSVYDRETRACIDELRDIIDVQTATAIWESALQTSWLSPPVWVHGDVAAGNLLLKQGKLCAVIDFGQLAAGDPACDVTIAWTLLTGQNREAFRNKLSVDKSTWTRGRGWALWKALLELRSHRQTNSAKFAKVQHVIDGILLDWADS